VTTLVKSDLSSLDFVINRFFYETRTNNIDVVKCCQYYFGFDLPSAIWLKRVQKFEAKFKECDNLYANNFMDILANIAMS